MSDRISGYQKALHRFNAERRVAEEAVRHQGTGEAVFTPQEVPKKTASRHKSGRAYRNIGFAVMLAMTGAVGWQAYSKTDGVVEVAARSNIAREVSPVEARPRNPGTMDVVLGDKSLSAEWFGERGVAVLEQPLPSSSVALADVSQFELPSRPITAAANTTDKKNGSTESVAAAFRAEAIPGDAAAGLAESSGLGQSDPGIASTKGPAQPQVDDGYMLQVAAVRNPSDVDATWDSIRDAFPLLLGGMALHVEKATVNGKIYYRIQTGPFSTETVARELCARLKAESQDCLVKRQPS